MFSSDKKTCWFILMCNSWLKVKLFNDLGSIQNMQSLRTSSAQVCGYCQLRWQHLDWLYFQTMHSKCQHLGKVTQFKFLICHQNLTEALLTSPQLSLLLCINLFPIWPKYMKMWLTLPTNWISLWHSCIRKWNIQPSKRHSNEMQGIWKEGRGLHTVLLKKAS